MRDEKIGDRLLIEGGRRLEGEVRVHGAKNAVLPILAASLLSGGVCIIYDCPDLTDVHVAFDILQHLGCRVTYTDGTAVVDAAAVSGDTIPDRMMREMRSSIMFLGAIISKMHWAHISYPGGCELGARPIDLHLRALEKLGVKVSEESGYIDCSLDKLHPAALTLNFPSVGATENVMLLTAVSDGTTTLSNAAREPEIVDLQNFLNAMGADIRGAGTDTIKIHGVKKLHGCEYRIIPDRIVAATYACAAAACGGEILLHNVIDEHLGIVLALLDEIGCSIQRVREGLWVQMSRRPKAAGMIRTLPYPGFPTDVQAQMMAVLCLANGTSVFSETMFESRYKHVEALLRMGADITLDGRTAVVKGRERLSGAEVAAQDLRGGAALVIAGLAAEGRSLVEGLHYIARGYASIDGDLRQLGARIYQGGR